MSEEEDFLLELKRIFIDELKDTLENLESAFLDFEKNPEDEEILSLIFRLFHNMKGSSKAVGMDALSAYAHVIENVLSKLRTKNISLTPDLIAELLNTTNLIHESLDQIAEGVERLPVLDDHAAMVAQISEGGGETASAPEPEPQDSNDGGFVSFEDDDAAEKLAAQSKTPAEPQAKPAAEVPEVTKAEPASQSEVNEVAAKKPPARPSKPKRPYIASIDGLQKSKAQQAEKRKTEENIKVSLQKIDTLIDYFGEQVILQSALHHLLMEEDLNMSKIKSTATQLRKVTQDLQYTMIRLRMVSMSTLYTRMERVVFDASRMANKNVKFVKVGTSNELDKTILDAMIDPLTHMVRNSVDHGVEPEEERVSIGKPPQGLVTMTSRRVGGNFEIILEDDGRGLDPEMLRQKAVKKGLIPASKELTESECFNLIFASGFSTKDVASELSGRGVGMDVVREKIEGLKGRCDVESVLGQGSKFTLRLPLSISMFNGTVVQIGQERYVVPNSDYVETIAFRMEEVQSTKQSGSLIRLREHVVRIIDLGNFMATARGKGKDCLRDDRRMIGIVGNVMGQYYAFLVDEILSQEQVVLKKLGPETRKIVGVSGGTILGDGKVALVLDINKISQHFSNAKKRAA